jgi:hypothetical protein
VVAVLRRSYYLSSPLSPILCNTILWNGVHLAATLLVFISRQVMSPVGRFHVLSPMFEIGSWAQCSLVLFSAQEENKHVFALESLRRRLVLLVSAVR